MNPKESPRFNFMGQENYKESPGELEASEIGPQAGNEVTDMPSLKKRGLRGIFIVCECRRRHEKSDTPPKAGA